MSGRRGCALVIGLIVLACLVSAAGLTAIYFMVGRGPTVSPRSTLVMSLSGALRDGGPADPFSALLPGRVPLTVRSLIENLRKARADARVSAILLKPSNLETPYWAKLQEIRDAIVDFRKSGKPVYACLEYAAEAEYLVASACDKVYLVPSSVLDLTGLAEYELFLRGTLDKIGAYPDLIHIGDYKTAANQLTEKAMTPAHREMAESLSRDRFDQLVRAIADGRKKTEAEVRALIDQGPFLPADAIRAGLVDDVAYEDEVLEKLKPKDGDSRRVDLDEYARISPRSVGLNRGPRIAVLYASGVIASGSGGYDPLNGTVLGSDTLAKSIRRIARDTSIKAVVLRIDSPGGGAVASDLIWHELVRLTQGKQARPLVVSMSDLAASGGYYIAVAAPTIVAEPGTLTGSIGIYGGKVVTGGTFAKVGVTLEPVVQGRMADMNSPLRPYNADERAKLDGQLHAFYDLFLERVARARRMSKEQVDKIAQGRVWTGRQARAIGLVDELGGLDRAVAIAKEQAKIPASTEVELVAYPPRQTIFDLLMSQMSLSGSRADLPWAWLLRARDTEQTGGALAPITLVREGEPLALMPYVFVRR